MIGILYPKGETKVPIMKRRPQASGQTKIVRNKILGRGRTMVYRRKFEEDWK